MSHEVAYNLLYNSCNPCMSSVQARIAGKLRVPHFPPRLMKTCFNFII